MDRRRSWHRGVTSCAIAALFMIGVHPAESQLMPSAVIEAQSSGEAESQALDAAQIEARLADVRQEIARAEIESRRVAADQTQADERVLDRLREIENLLVEQAVLAKSPVESDAAKPAFVETEKSVFALNALLEVQARSDLADELADRRAALTKAKESLARAESMRRKARQTMEQAAGDARAMADQNFELRVLDARVAQERVHLRTLETRAAHARQESAAADSAAEAAIAEMRAAITAEKGDSSRGFGALTRREGEVRRERESAERRLATAQRRLDAAEKRFSSLSNPSDALIAELDAYTAQRDAVRQEIALADARVERLASQRQVWRRWDALLRGAVTKAEVPEWTAQADERIARRKDEELRHDGHIADLENRMAKLDDRLADTTLAPELRAAFEGLRETLRRLQEGQRAEVKRLAADRRLAGRFLEDLEGQSSQLNPFELAAETGRQVLAIWSYEITTVDDEPITVGSLVLALMFFGIGFWAARRGSGFVGRIAQARFKLDVGGAHALETLSFYFLLVGFMLMALRVVHFPLTAFTVLGGAAAIGIGFGSQNVMNNFISGLILMLERPVRARDMVEIDGNYGTIEAIGARSTQIRSSDGRHIVVPNSFFLESNVVNWTLSDDLIRGRVTVGLAYGSPTRLVEELIQRVVDEEPKVLKTPPAIVLFSDFGDNALTFDVHFWVTARTPMEVMKVQSLMRYRIDDLFREHDLVIAFPQRDVHLDSLSPVEVRVLNGPANTSDTANTDNSDSVRGDGASLADGKKPD